MKELSLSILDIVQNSLVAGAGNISVSVAADVPSDLLTITVTDDGCGMDKEFLARVIDPFTTTRTTRKVGLGIPLFKLAAEQSGGRLEITSEVGKGTEVKAEFSLSHIDRPPLGDMGQTLALLINGNPDVHFTYTHSAALGSLVLDTDEMKLVLGDIPLDSPEIFEWIAEYVNSGLAETGPI